MIKSLNLDNLMRKEKNGSFPCGNIRTILYNSEGVINWNLFDG